MWIEVISFVKAVITGIELLGLGLGLGLTLGLSTSFRNDNHGFPTRKGQIPARCLALEMLGLGLIRFVRMTLSMRGAKYVVKRLELNLVLGLGGFDATPAFHGGLRR